MQVTKDGNGDLSVLQHYCQVLRLVSGLPATAVLSLADGVHALKAENNRVMQMRASPKVQEFIGFLRTLPDADQRTVWAMLAQELFPGIGKTDSLFGGIRHASSVREATEQCHEDVLQADGRGALLRYVSTYNAKFSGAFASDWLNEASDFSSAHAHPEPEMWLSLCAHCLVFFLRLLHRVFTALPRV